MEDLQRQMGVGSVPEGKDRIYMAFDLNHDREPRDQMIEQVCEQVPGQTTENIATDTMYGNPPKSNTADVPRPCISSVAARPPPMNSRGVAFYSPQEHANVETQVPSYYPPASRDEEARQLQAGIIQSYRHHGE